MEDQYLRNSDLIWSYQEWVVTCCDHVYLYLIAPMGSYLDRIDGPKIQPGLKRHHGRTAARPSESALWYAGATLCRYQARVRQLVEKSEWHHLRKPKPWDMWRLRYTCITCSSCYWMVELWLSWLFLIDINNIYIRVFTQVVLVVYPSVSNSQCLF